MTTCQSAMGLTIMRYLRNLTNKTAIQNKNKDAHVKCNTISVKHLLAGFAAVLLTAVLSLNSSSVLAQTNPGQSGTLRSQHGAWSILCDKPAGAKTEQCALIQNVIAADRPELGLSVVVLKTADNKARILRVLAPLGVLLPNGLGLNIDGKDIGRAYFVRCFEDGCYAEVILDDELIDTFRKGSAATFIVFQTPEEGVGIPVELEGFSDGFNKLP